MEKLDKKLYPNLSKMQEQDPELLMEMLAPLMEQHGLTFLQASEILENDFKTQDFHDSEDEDDH